MVRSINTFDDEAFSSGDSDTDPEEGSLTEDNEEEEGSEKDSSDEERPESLISRTNLPVKDKVNFFDTLTKRDPEGASSEDNKFFDDDSDDSSRFQEGFHDETSFGSQPNSDDSGSDEDDGSEDGSDGESGSESESGSEDGSDSGSDSNEDGSSGSEEYSSGSETTESGENADRNGLLDDEQGHGMYSSANYNRRRRLFFIVGPAICCVILLALVIGLPVGLSNRNKNEDETDDAPAMAPVRTLLPTAPVPTNPPVRMPVSLPKRPNARDPETINVEVLALASSDTTIYREGESKESTNGSEDTMLVQSGDPENSELPPAYSLVEFSVDPKSYSYILGPTFNSTFCLEHVPTEDDGQDEIVTYSACVINVGFGNGVPEGGVDGLTGETAFYVMPDDCLFIEAVNFSVSPSDTKICMDLNPMVGFALMGNNQQRRALRGTNSGRSLQDGSENENKTVVVMIDTLVPSDRPGDRFYTSNSEESEKFPSLTINGEEIAECKTIGDLACTDERLSTLCGMIQATGLDALLGDNRQTLTAFAPTNDAIEAAVENDVIDPNDNDFLVDLLLYHVVPFVEMKSKDLNCESPMLLPLAMANGNNTEIRCREKDTFVVGEGNSGANWPKITESDIETCNGIVHVIDKMIFTSTLSDVIGEDILD